MTSDSISEATFLLTELRYTLGQLHVQVLDLDTAQRAQETASGRSVNTVLRDMAGAEATYQERIRGMAGTEPAPDDDHPDIPLPISNAEADDGREYGFEHQRARTIAMLEALGDTWPSGLVELVREQVRHDRQLTGELATLRMSLYNQETRLDLDQPLTEHPEPHQLEHE